MRIALPALFAGVLFATAPVFAAPCASLTALKLSNTTITAAQGRRGGSFQAAYGRPPGAACR